MTDRIKIEVDASEVGKAKKELEKLTTSVEELEGASQSTGKTFVQAQKELYALGSVSRTVSKAVDEVTDALIDSTKELKSIASTAQKAGTATEYLGETEEQAALRIKKVAAAAIERSKAIREAAESSRSMSRTLSEEAGRWQDAVKSQNQSMSAYHKAEQALERQAIAEAKASEEAQKAAVENDKKRVALTKLLGVIDKTEKALDVLDKQEIELSKHFKEGRIDIDAYNNALAKIQSKRNALTNIKKEAKNTTLEVNKLSKAVKVLSGLLVTGIAGYGVVSFGKSVIETSLQWEKAKTIMDNATGSASKAAKELDFVKDVSKKLNIELISAANGYAKLVAAAKDSPELGKEVRGMFEGVSEAAAVLKLAPHEVNSILTNYEQMISSGKVNLTDLKQIANLIPGTMEKAAKALGTNTQQLSEWISKGLIPASEFLPRFSDELHNAFGGSAQKSADGLQGRLTALTNAWTDLKIEAGNAGFIDTFSDAVRELTNALKDPSMKEGLNILIKGLGDLSKFTLENFANASGNVRRYAEEVAKFTTGDIAADDIKGIMDNVERYENLVKQAQQRLAKYSDKNYMPNAGEAIGQFITNTTIDDEIDDAKASLSKYQEILKGWIKARDLYNSEIAKSASTHGQKALDPLVKSYQDVKEKLAESQKQVTDQLKSSNGQVDAALAEQVSIYQDKFSQINKEVQDKYDELTEEQSWLSEKMVALQRQYANEAANLTEEQKVAILNQINDLKKVLPDLQKVIDQYKPLVTISSRPAFTPIEKPKKTGRSGGQKQGNDNERWIEGLEKQNATMNLGKAATLEYEISQRKLSGALLERANAIKAVVEREQELANARKINSMHIEILRLTGDDYTADLLELENKFKDTIKELEKEGNEGGKVIAQNLFDAGKAKLQLDKIKAEIEKAFTNQSTQEQSIQAQVTAGAITQYEAQKRITELHKQTAATVKGYLPELKKAAELPGEMGEQSRQYLAELNSQLLILEATTNELENAFRNGLQDGIQSSIEGLVKETMDLQEALNNFLDSIASNILNVAAQNIAQDATNSIMGGLSGIGSFFGFDTGMEDQSTPEAAAISSASQQGAMAMQMAIEQGAMTAAQTLSSVMSTMGSMKGLGGDAGLFGNVTQNAQEAIGAINSVKTTKQMADTALTASAATSAATTQATTTAAAASAQAAWAAPAAAASTASFGSAAMIGLAALMSVMTAMKAFKTGGHVTGAGTGTSDSIPARLSNGEFVTRASVVKQPGMLEFMNDLNRRGWGAVFDRSPVMHSTGGLAGIPAPNLPAPVSMGISPVESSGSSTTLKNSQNFYVVDDPNKIGESILNNDHTKQSFMIFLEQNSQKIKSTLEV